MDLPKNEKSFLFNHTGELTGRKYEGTFTVKCVLNMADKRRLEIEKSSISADLMNPTNNLSAIATVVANLRVRVVNSPDWFKQSIQTLDLLDEDVIFEIYSQCLNKSEEWITEVKKSSVGDQGNLQKES
jgi:hypothetical protein